MHINGITIDIDVIDYLTSKRLRSVKRVGANVMACCPFHDDRTPSFSVNADTGAWLCFGCGAKGAFASLIKRLETFPTVFDAEQYLIAKYGRYSSSDVTGTLELNFGDKMVLDGYGIAETTLETYTRRPDVLSNRGVKSHWSNVFDVRYNTNTDANKRSIVFPYRDERGRLVTTKHRSVVGKSFWYDPPLPSRIKARILYGMDVVLRYGVKRLAVTEAEIDAISVWQACYDELGVGCVALGGKTLTDEQEDVLIRHLPPDTEIIVATDNDVAGRHAERLIADRLLGRYNVTTVDWSAFAGAKDANDVLRQCGEQAVIQAFRRRKGVPLDVMDVI